MNHRFHILGLAHTVTTPEYSHCAFTAKVLKLCKMLRARGHYVIHYGHEDSRVDCDEHVTVTTQADLARVYPGHDWKTQGFPNFQIDDGMYQTFLANAVPAIRARQKRGDFLLCSFGAGHRQVADSLSDLIVVEPGIGYPGGTFAPFRVYESYAIMHVLQGREGLTPSNDFWYSAVIPNYFDLADFTFSPTHDDYLLFLGRVNEGKGIHVAIQIAEKTGTRLVVAGMGAVEAGHPLVEHVGVASPEMRRQLMSRAKATICASTYIEPFCGVQIESMLSGTPVISTDRGAFAEYNLHGVTGYRCQTFEQFLWAAKNIDKISRHDCYAWASENFSLERVGALYEEYFGTIARQQATGSWYAPNDERRELDWLRKYHP